MIKSISSFSGISVSNIEDAKKFYVDVLGLTLKSEDMGLTFDLPGGGELFVYEKPNHVPAEFTVLNFVVQNIDETIDHLVAEHNATFERYDNMPFKQDERGVARGKEAGYGPNIAWFKDPFGNILALIEA